MNDSSALGRLRASVYGLVGTGRDRYGTFTAADHADFDGYLTEFHLAPSLGHRIFGSAAGVDIRPVPGDRTGPRATIKASWTGDRPPVLDATAAKGAPAAEIEPQVTALDLRYERCEQLPGRFGRVKYRTTVPEDVTATDLVEHALAVLVVLGARPTGGVWEWREIEKVSGGAA